MPFRMWVCEDCEYVWKTKKDAECCEYCGNMNVHIVLTAPKTKFMEKTDSDRNKSQIKNQQKILRERARKHSRDNEMHDLVQNNPMEEAVKNGWIREDGRTRKAIDDK